MSKKKRRYHAKRKPHCTRSPLDKHHICYQRRYWNVGYLRELREFWYSKIMIPRDTLHHQIHQEVGQVPPPKSVNARAALVQLRNLERYGAIKETDNLERRLEIYIALFDCVEQATADGFRRQLEVVRKFNQKSP